MDIVNIADLAGFLFLGFGHAATADMMMVRRMVRIPELRRLT